MSNGDYLPNCTNCQHYRSRLDKHCSLHRAVLPSLGTETICRDWSASEGLTDNPDYAEQAEGFLKNPIFLSLKKGVLYYDASYALSPVRLFYAELGPFESLLKIVGAWISHDDQYDWIVYLEPYGRGDERYRYFPPVGSRILLELGSKSVRYEVGEIGRRFLWSREDPDALKNWLDSFVDGEGLWQEAQTFSSEHFDTGSGIPVFIEVSQQGMKYKAIPALYLYPERLRR